MTVARIELPLVDETRPVAERFAKESRDRAFLVDDEPPARARLRQLLAEAGDVLVVGEAVERRSRRASAIAETHPDVVFLDIEMPEGSRHRAGRRRCRSRGPSSCLRRPSIATRSTRSRSTPPTIC